MKRSLAAILMLMLWTHPVFSETAEIQDRYEELAAKYTARSEGRGIGAELEVSLMAEAEDLRPIDLWRTIKDLRIDPGQRAANGLELIRRIFPGGDPGRWEEISGFWLPQTVPKPLAAFDALYYTALALIDLEEPGAPWLAQQILEQLLGSSRATFLAVRTAPREYLDITARLEAHTGMTPMGGWPKAEISGMLPFAHSTSFYVTQDHAVMRGMTFLNASGQPTSGMGPYAWDRKRGRVYRVAEPRDEIKWWLIPLNKWNN